MEALLIFLVIIFLIFAFEMSALQAVIWILALLAIALLVRRI